MTRRPPQLTRRASPPQRFHFEPQRSRDLLKRRLARLFDALHLRIGGLCDADTGSHFGSTKAAIKLHTLLDLRGAIPAFIHISDGKLHDVNVLLFNF